MTRGTDGSEPRGQSLVEFALVLPMLLVLLLGIADFGRVFQAGISIEATARNGAEVAALERLREPPPIPGDVNEVAYYQHLHRTAAETVCRELKILPNVAYVADDPTSLTVDEEACPANPAIRVCVRDNQDPICGAEIPGFSPLVPAQCSEIADPAPAWTNASGGDIGSHAVEVRVCYQFTTLFNLHVSLPFNAGLGLGDIYLQRTRLFLADCPPPPAAISTC